METINFKDIKALVISNREVAREIRAQGGDQFAADALDESAKVIEYFIKGITHEKAIL